MFLAPAVHTVILNNGDGSVGDVGVCHQFLLNTELDVIRIGKTESFGQLQSDLRHDNNGLPE